MFKCQRKDRFTRQVHAILYFVHTTMYNIINCNHSLVLIRFRKQRFSRQPICQGIWFRPPCNVCHTICTNKPVCKIYQCMTARSIRHHTLLHISMILHTKKFLVRLSPAHDIPLYARSLRKTSYPSTYEDIFAPVCHPRQKILSDSNTIQTHIQVVTFPFFLFKC